MLYLALQGCFSPPSARGCGWGRWRELENASTCIRSLEALWKEKDWYSNPGLELKDQETCRSIEHLVLSKALWEERTPRALEYKLTVREGEMVTLGFVRRHGAGPECGCGWGSRHVLCFRQSLCLWTRKKNLKFQCRTLLLIVQIWASKGLSWKEARGFGLCWDSVQSDGTEATVWIGQLNSSVCLSFLPFLSFSFSSFYFPLSPSGIGR